MTLVGERTGVVDQNVNSVVLGAHRCGKRSHLLKVTEVGGDLGDGLAGDGSPLVPRSTRVIDLGPG